MARIEGLEALQRNVNRLGKRAPQVLGKAFFEEGQVILAQSKVLVPVDTGALRASGSVNGPNETARGIEVTIGYGGPSAPYAIFVHERLDVFHKPPTRAKFLEGPFRRRMRGMTGRIARRVRRELERGVSR